MVKEYDKVEDYYADTNVNFGEGVKINFGSTDPAQALGQNVNVSLAPQANNQESFRTPFLSNLQNTKYDSSKDYNVLSGKAFSQQLNDYNTMLKDMGYTDKANSGFNAKNVLSTIAKGPIDLKSAFFDPKGLTGPTGKSVLNLGMISEMEMKAHYDNFSEVNDAYAKMNETEQSFNSTDLGFAATVGSFHFSRPPNRGYYNGLKSHIDGGSGNGHQMLKTIEALEKGFDPNGFRLDGKNENNGGLAHSSKSMGAGITEDGYYVSVANNGFGYSKSVLAGIAKGTESDIIAAEMGISQAMLIDAMEMARADKDVTVSQAIAQLTSTGKDDKDDKDDRDATSITSNFGPSGFDSSGYFSGMNEGGQVGQLADILRQNRLGMNLGGQAQQPQINVNELGFVDNKTPDQVTDAQSVADDKPLNMRDNDYMLNSPAVKKHGIRNTVNMIMRALKDASAAGVQIVDMPPDIPRDELVKVAASASEVRVPRDLVPFIGLANLETINEKGKPEVKRRARLT